MIKEYLKETINTKRNLKETIRTLENQIDTMLKTIKEYESAKDYALEQQNKFKVKAEEEHKKFCILEIQSVQREEELKKEIRSLKRENKKLEKELCTNAITVDANSDNQEK